MPTFPALDPEPTRREVWRRRLWPAAGTLGVCVVGAGIAAGVILGTGGTTKPAATASAHPSAKANHPKITAGGLVVLANQDGQIFVSRPDGSHRKEIGRLRHQASGAAVSGNGQSIVTTSPGGDLYVLGGGVGFGQPTDVIPVGRRHHDPLGLPDQPWSDHGDALVVTSTSGGHLPVLLETNLRTTATKSLGDGIDASGDPAAKGALVAKGTAGPIKEGQQSVLPVDALQLRDLGKRPTDIMTARFFAVATSQPPKDPYTLSGFFSPDGQTVAVFGHDLSKTSQGYGLLLIKRDGATPIYEINSGGAQVFGGDFAHDNHAFVYTIEPTKIDQGKIVFIDLSSPRKPALTVRFAPNSIDFLGGCLWSPNDKYVMCDGGRTGRILVDASTGKREVVDDVSPSDQVLAWLPGSGP